MAKFTNLDNAQVDYDYGDRYYREPCGNSERLVIGPSGKHINLIDLLTAKFGSDRFYVLYVLLISHAGYDLARYQSPIIEEREDFRLFIWTFQEFFEGDGRHHIWFKSADTKDLIVYDQHNVLFVYGDLVVPAKRYVTYESAQK